MANNEKTGIIGSVLKVGSGIVVGAAAGIVVGLLIAPKSGKEVLSDVKEVSLKFKDNASNYVNDVKGKGEDIIKKSTAALKLSEGNSAVTLPVKKTSKVEPAVEVETDIVTKVEELKENTQNSAENLLARIQGITAETIE
jgi:Gas vesicle protein